MKNDETHLLTDFRECANARMRRTMRALNRIYDQALKPAGIKSTQFTLLATLSAQNEIPLTKLSDILALDRTTLSRNLGPLAARGWIRIERDQDERLRIISITSGGVDKLDEAAPLWRRAQKQVVDHVGVEQLTQLSETLTTLQEVNEH